MRLTAQWLKFQVCRFQARRWLKAQGPKVAAWCMFRLNQHARYRYGNAREDIYAMKNVFVRLLYQAGYCTQVTKHIQKYTCWSCNGTGEYWTGDECYKCDGSGIYRQHTLYLFRFSVDGRRFAWHQPGSLVTWDIELSEQQPQPYAEKEQVVVQLQLELLMLYMATVYEYLRGQGVTVIYDLPRRTRELPSWPGLWEALKSDLRAKVSYYRLKRQLSSFIEPYLDRWIEFLRLQSEVEVGQVAMTKAGSLVRVVRIDYGNQWDPDTATVEFLRPQGGGNYKVGDRMRCYAYKLRPVKWPAAGAGLAAVKLEKVKDKLCEDEIPF